MSRRGRTWCIMAMSLAVAACGHSPLVTPPPAAPVISCPGDVSRQGVQGGAAEVTFPPPTTQGGTLPLAVSCTPASGTPFALGATPVSCTATDAQGRQSICSFLVTLTPPILDVTRFIAFGDSLTEGENGRFRKPWNTFIDFPNVYPTMLEGKLNAEYPDQGIVVLNRGTSGDPVERSVQKLPGVLEADRGGALLLLDGYNNLLADCPPGQSGTAACGRKINDVVAGLRDCIRIAQISAYGIKYVFVSTLTPPGPLAGPRDRRIAADAIIRTNVGIAAMAPAEGAVVVDTYARFVGHEAEYVDQDGLHLRPAGYEALAASFFDAIRQTVSSTVAVRTGR